MDTEFLSLQACVRGGIYRLHSRNLLVGVFDGERGFVGIRRGFGRTFLSTEYHWDIEPSGTACPTKLVGRVPTSILLTNDLPAVCAQTGRPVSVETVEGAPAGWSYVYADTQEPLPEDYLVRSPPNDALFDFLLPFDVAENDRRSRERWEIRPT